MLAREFIFSVRGNNEQGPTLTGTNAAKIRKFQAVIDTGKNMQKPEFPNVKYHRRCRSLFTLKRDLQKINCDNDNKITSSSSSSGSTYQKSAVSQQRECEKTHASCILCQKTKGINTTENYIYALN